MKNIAILTSCINANTEINVFGSKELRRKYLVENINYLNGTNLFDHIFIVDASKEKSLNDDDDLKKYLLDYGLRLKNNNSFYIFKPDSKTKSEIEKRGKGFSELKMFQYILKKISFKNDKNVVIHKISGRYKILNIKKLINETNKVFNKNYIFYQNISNLLKRSITYYYSFRSDFNSEIFNKITSEVFDKKGIYVEHLFYRKIFKNSNIKSKRSRLDVVLSRNHIGGSGQGKNNLIKSLLKRIFYCYL